MSTQFFSGIIFLLPDRCSFKISYVGQLVTNSCSCCDCKRFSYLTCLETGIFVAYWILGWQGVFSPFSTSKIASASSFLQCFSGEIGFHSYLCSFVHNVSFFYDYFWGFLFIFGSKQFEHDVPWCDFSSCLLGFVEYLAVGL